MDTQQKEKEGDIMPQPRERVEGTEAQETEAGAKDGDIVPPPRERVQGTEAQEECPPSCYVAPFSNDTASSLSLFSE